MSFLVVFAFISHFLNIFVARYAISSLTDKEK